MAKRRDVDPNQKSLFGPDVQLEPPRTVPLAQELPPLSDTSPTPQAPPIHHPTYAVYVPLLKMWSSVTVALPVALSVLPQPEVMSLSYKVGIGFAATAFMIVMTVIEMFIPWRKVRRAGFMCVNQRSAIGLQSALVILPLIFAAILFNTAVSIAGNEFEMAYRTTREQWNNESIKREWQNKTIVVPTPRNSETTKP
jgi:hypothetical protein